MKYTELLGNKENFKNAVQDTLNRIAYTRVDEIKKEVANDFLTNNGDEDGSTGMETED